MAITKNSIKKTIRNLLTTLATITMLAGMNNAHAMQKQKRKAQPALTPETSETKRTCMRSPEPEEFKEAEAALPEEEKEEEEQQSGREDSESEYYSEPEESQNRPEPHYLNHTGVAWEMEGAELFANNGEILNAEFEDIFVLIKKERAAQAQEKRAQNLARAQAHTNTHE